MTRNAAFDILWTGFEGLEAQDVKGPQPGAVILFARNLDPDPVTGPERCHGLIAGLQSRWGAELPLAVALDQEGGAVSRLKGWVGSTPDFHRIWERGGGAACARWGGLWGRGLRLLGFSVDLAPVADLWDGVLGDRCASAEPLAVAEAAGSFLNGLEATGVRGCLKHFPGLGGTRVDSHQALPELRDMAQIDRNLQPFRALSHRERLVMVAHLKTPGTCGLPASLHRGSVASNPWSIRGRWIPDDLEMGGCRDWAWEDRVRLCLEAGHEALLVCQTEEGMGACAEALASLPEKCWAQARERFLTLRRNLLPPPTGAFDRLAWEAWLAEVRLEAAVFAG